MPTTGILTARSTGEGRQVFETVPMDSAPASGNTVGAYGILYRFELLAGALADTDIIVTQKIRVIDAWLILQGAGVSTTTLQVKNGTGAITQAMAASGSDQAVVRNATLDDSTATISAGGTLRVTSATGASQPAAVVYVLALPAP